MNMNNIAQVTKLFHYKGFWYVSVRSDTISRIARSGQNMSVVFLEAGKDSVLVETVPLYKLKDPDKYLFRIHNHKFKSKFSDEEYTMYDFKLRPFEKKVEKEPDPVIEKEKVKQTELFDYIRK